MLAWALRVARYAAPSRSLTSASTARISATENVVMAAAVQGPSGAGSQPVCDALGARHGGLGRLLPVGEVPQRLGQQPGRLLHVGLPAALGDPHQHALRLAEVGMCLLQWTEAV